jgi:uncharacterized protein (PEP-CTERM system associated)
MRCRLPVAPARAALAFAMGVALSPGALAQQVWHFEPGIDTLFTLTDNVDLAPNGDRKADFVTQLTPELKLSERGAHTRLEGTVRLPVLLYARTGSENNQVLPEVNLSGIAELVERLFYIEAATDVSQQYVSPFAPRPSNLTNATNNRYTAQTYRISPLLKGKTGDGYAYELRDDNIFANESNTSFQARRSYTNSILARFDRDPRPFGYGLEYDRSETRFVDETPLRNQIVRGRAAFQQSAQLHWSLIGGYEDNNYQGPTHSDAIYGVAARWRPTDRTTLDASVEHRFFGGSYHVAFDHRTPLTVWSLRADRDITTFPQELAALSANENVSTLLDRLFTSRLPDQVQRQTFVDQVIRERGLPTVLTGPLALFTQQVTLQEGLQGTAGIVGARNTILATIYRQRTRPVGNLQGTLETLLFEQDTTQTGGNIVWTWRVTPFYSLSTSADYSHAVDNVSDIRSRLVTLRSTLSAKVSQRTDLSFGVRWQRMLSSTDNSYREAAMFVGIRYVDR